MISTSFLNSSSSRGTQAPFKHHHILTITHTITPTLKSMKFKGSSSSSVSMEALEAFPEGEMMKRPTTSQWLFDR